MPEHVMFANARLPRRSAAVRAPKVEPKQAKPYALAACRRKAQAKIADKEGRVFSFCGCMMTPESHSSQQVTPPAAMRPRYDYGASTAAPARVAATVPTATAARPAPAEIPGWVVWLGVLFVAAFLALYWNNFSQLSMTWAKKASWSHGYAVPLLAGVLVYLQWDKIAHLVVKGAAIGLALVAYGVATQVLFSVVGQPHLANLSMLVVLLGAVLYVLGWDYLKVLWLPIGYLGFMIPLPDSLYVRVTAPMQTIAAEAGVQLLPLFGINAQRSGTVIEVLRAGKWEELTIAEACSGIRMLLAFVALAVALAYTTNRPMWQKVLLAGCAVPVAIFCNALRVTLTGVFFVWLGNQWAHGAAHEYLGFVMLVPALGLQLLMAWILDRVFIEVKETEGKQGRGAEAAMGGTR